MDLFDIMHAIETPFVNLSDRIRRFFRGENIDVTIIRLAMMWQHSYYYDHTIVKLADGRVRYAAGHLGNVGDVINVNTWDLGKL